MEFSKLEPFNMTLIKWGEFVTFKISVSFVFNIQHMKMYGLKTEIFEMVKVTVIYICSL